MMDIPKFEDDGAGYPKVKPCWIPSQIPDTIKATLVCPNGHQGSIVSHTVAADGTVTPSCVCPREGCTFHEHVRFLNWQ